MECHSLFSGKNKKKYLRMLSAEIFCPACRALTYNYLMTLLIKYLLFVSDFYFVNNRAEVRCRKFKREN